MFTMVMLNVCLAYAVYRIWKNKTPSANEQATSTELATEAKNAELNRLGGQDQSAELIRRTRSYDSRLSVLRMFSILAGIRSRSPSATEARDGKSAAPMERPLIDSRLFPVETGTVRTIMYCPDQMNDQMNERDG